MSETKQRVDAILLGQFIKRQRKLRGLTQAEVAEKAGKKQGQIARLESGQVSTVSIDDVPAYAEGVGSTARAALRAVKHPSVMIDSDSEIVNEEAVAIAEAYTNFQTEEAREIIRQALSYADKVEKGTVIGGTRAE